MNTREIILENDTSSFYYIDNDNFINSDEILRYCKRKWKDVNIMIKNYEHGIWLKELTDNMKIIRDFMDVEKIEK